MDRGRNEEKVFFCKFTFSCEDNIKAMAIILSLFILGLPRKVTCILKSLLNVQSMYIITGNSLMARKGGSMLTGNSTSTASQAMEPIRSTPDIIKALLQKP